MERFFQLKRKPQSSSSSSTPDPNSIQENQPVDDDNTKKSRSQFNTDDLVYDPGKRPPIESYDPNIRDDVRMAYLEKGPCQPHGHNFPRRSMGNYTRCFRKEWFSEFYWLEYSIEKDAAYCLYCYLFKPDRGGQGGGYVFTKTGFRDWRHKKTLTDHVGNVDSVHNQALNKCTMLMNQKQSISYAFSSQNSVQQRSYRTRLTAILDCTRFLLMQGLAFRGRDETKESLNKGNLIELLEWYAARCEEVANAVFTNAPGNDQMIAPSIQKDLINCCAVETTKAIMKEMGDSLFSILVDESRDNSVREQMAMVLRFVDNSGHVKERFLGISHVPDTCAQSLKDAIDVAFSKHGLSISSIRGQGYDGASNMSGEFNGLKALILRENPYAFYIHCFAHQLQLSIVSVARRNVMLGDLFLILTTTVNLVGASCKRVDALRTSYHSEILVKLNAGEVFSGTGQFQEMSLARPGDTRWGSHLVTITRFIAMFNNIIDVLEDIADDGTNAEQRTVATNQMKGMQEFEFVFCLHFMLQVLVITNDLSQALQKKDQDIQNAMNLLNDRFSEIDSILQELNDRFSETTTELLICIACLSPKASFAAFDRDKLLRLAQFYPLDFTNEDLILLKHQLDKFLLLVTRDKDFFNLNSISHVAQKLVETGKSCYFSLVYRLITLTLILPVATASVERAFSAMNLIKSDLRNKMGDDWLNDSLVIYTERKIFKQIENEAILQRFQSMRPRRMQLSELTTTE